MNDVTRSQASKFLMEGNAIDWDERVVGHTVTAYELNGTPVRVVVETIVHNLTKPWKMEINGKYLVSVLELAAAINGEKLPKSAIDEFDRYWSRAEVVAPQQRNPLLLPQQPHERKKAFSFLKGLKL